MAARGQQYSRENGEFCGGFGARNGVLNGGIYRANEGQMGIGQMGPLGVRKSDLTMLIYEVY